MAEICKCTKTIELYTLNRVICMVCESYLNKAVKKEV